MSQSNPLREARADAQRGNLSAAAKKCLAVLSRSPKNLEAIDLYGDLAVQMGRNTDAITVFQKLLVLRPEDAPTHDRLAHLYFHHGERNEAASHAREALRLDSCMKNALIVLGSLHLHQDRDDEAREYFDRARDLQADHFEVDLAYANALLISGRFEQASDILRTLIALRPDNGSLYDMLSRAQKLHEGNPDVTLIRSLADSDGQLRPELRDHDGTHSVPAWRALYKVESDIGNYAKAFTYLKAAKDLRKTQVSFDKQAISTLVSDMRDVFDASLTATGSSQGSSAEQPIFVVGMPRSGTTLLERILATHENIVAAGELPLVNRICEELCAKLGDNQYDLAALKKLPDGAWREVGDEYMRRASNVVPAGMRFVDKSVSHYLHLGFIKAMLPRAKIIHITRHPVANCLSLYECDFRSAHAYCNDLRWLGEQYLQYQQIMDYWHSLFGEDIINIDYEAMVTDQAGAAHTLGQGLGLDLNLSDLSRSQGQGTIHTASVWQARQPIHTGSVARWEQLREQLHPLLDTLAPILEE